MIGSPEDRLTAQLKDLLEAAVVGDDLPVEVDDQNPVGGGLERRLQDGDRQGIDDPTGFLRPRSSLRTALWHGPNLRVSGPVTNLTGAQASRI